MICKNCAAEYDDSYSFCPVCGKEKFSVEIPEYPEFREYREYTDISSFSDNAGCGAEDSAADSEEAFESGGNKSCYDLDSEVTEDAHISSETQVFSLGQENEDADLQCDENAVDEEPEQITQQSVEGGEVSGDEEKTEETPEAVTEKQPERKRTVRRMPAINKKEENRTLAVIIAVMCVVAVLAASLSALRISTDTLETTEPVEKVVASVGLSTQEELMLEEVVARCFSALKADFNSELTDAESFLERVNPYDRGGVYSMIYNEYPELQSDADPAQRFYNEESGAYAYYRLEEKKIDDLMSMFGISAHHEINSQNCYYYDGYYYFAPVVQKMTYPVKAEITKSKRVLDGSYYSECYFYAESGDNKVQTDTFYLLVEKKGDIQSKEVSFVIKRMSTTPIFDAGGKLAEARTYKIKKQVLEGKTSDAKLYCRYTFEYPVFTGDNVGYQAINTFFTDAINAYKLRADSAQNSYEGYLEQGGKAEDLPLTETLIARVSYENEKYISIVEKIGITDPTPAQSTPATSQEDDEYSEDGGYAQQEQDGGVTLFTRTVDGYVFDKSTGEFVSKDVLVGKDYMVVSEILYRIYNGYEYESIIPEAKTEDVTDEYGEVIEEEAEEDYEEEYYYSDDEIPDDEDGFGTAIYESACAFTQQGLTFYYMNSDSVVEEVTIPFAVVERLAQS